jgi:soluble lytic murein transglycosylase
MMTFHKRLLAAGLLVFSAASTGAQTLDAGQISHYAQELRNNGRSVFAPPPEAVASIANPDPLAEKLVLWDRLRRDSFKGSFSDYSQFLLANPEWPLERALRLKAEQALLSTEPMATRVAFFERFAPISSTAKLRYAEALASAGRMPAAQEQVRSGWALGGFSAGDEALALTAYGNWLSPADHAARVNAQLWAGQTTSAQRTLALLSAEARALAVARIAYKSGAPDAEALFDALPAAAKQNAGLILDRTGWLRRIKKDELGARQYLMNAAVDPATVYKPVLWVKDRRRLSDAALQNGELNTAYQLLAAHKMAANYADFANADEENRIAFVETEWQAGWIALRYLRKSQEAFNHFRNMQIAARTPITQARAAYWAGRAAEGLNNGPLAQQWYGTAAQFQDYFYGQLASDKLGKQIIAPDMNPPKINDADLAAFNVKEPVRAARLLGILGERDAQTQFISLLAQRATTIEEKRIAADLAHSIDRLDLGVRIGKLSRSKGLSLGYAAYPRVTLPADMARLWSYVHAITRQESLFDTRAISRAGARGMMQLMPPTAKEVSRKMGVPYDFAKLTGDPAYNMMLGSTYFAELLDRFGGNHVLAIASYNAGAGNVNKWLIANGDPRDPSVDVVDWIEQIPFEETSTYVQRVLENAVVYKMISPERRDLQGYNVLSEMLGRAKSS